MARNQPEEITWEVTSHCNMNCTHCSARSSFTGSEEELTTDAALALCNEIAELGVRRVVITGGEPLLRRDVYDVVQKLTSLGVEVSLITNGWYLDLDTARWLRLKGLATVIISLDGLAGVHDSLRCPGAYSRVLSSLCFLSEVNLQSSVVTTLNRLNVVQLPELYGVLQAHGVVSWRLQTASPIGNLAKHRDLLIDREDVAQVLRFLMGTVATSELRVVPACSLRYVFHDFLQSVLPEDIGVCSAHNPVVDGSAPSLWSGCPRGRLSFSILSDGSIVGCYGQRRAGRTEGQAPAQPLAQVWSDGLSFASFRQPTPPCFFTEVRRLRPR
jgi:MoaA/NifB/PqqE/SkfB family radical SAM enzyme